MSARRIVRQRLIQENEFPNIPSDWDVERMRFLFQESKERNGKNSVGQMLSVSEYRGVIPRDYANEDQKRTEEELENYKVVRPGQLAVNSMWLNHLGLGVSDHLGHVSPAYNVYQISDRLDRRFVHHLMRSNYYLKIYLRYLYGIRPNSFQIKSNDWASIPIIVPDLSTQRAIADYLDRETARIDLLIEQKQRLVELLGEKRSAIITTAVTGNAQNSNRFAVEGGDGVSERQHLGWTKKRIKHHLLGFFGGGTPSKDNEAFWTNGTVPWVSPKDMKQKKISSSEDYITAEAVINSAANMVPINSVLMVVRSGILKHSIPTAINTESVSLNQDMKAFRFLKSMLPEFFLYWIDGQQKQLLQDWVQVGATVENINTRVMLNSEISVPDLPTQRTIADFLDCETTRIDHIREKTRVSIDRLREYRSSLITAAVTGQIDVSKWVKAGNAERRLDAAQATVSV